MTRVLLEMLLVALGAGVTGWGFWLYRRSQRKKRQTQAELEATYEIIDRLSHEQWTYLSAQWHSLSGTLDFHHTLRTVACMLVPDEADVCVVDFLGEEGNLTRAIHRKDGGTQLADEILVDVRLDLAGPTQQVMKAGAPLYMSGLPDPFSAGNRACALMALPLKTRDRFWARSCWFATSRVSRTEIVTCGWPNRLPGGRCWRLTMRSSTSEPSGKFGCGSGCWP